MILRTKIPDSCADLCPAKVERTLEKHFSDIYAAARELGVPGPDLRRLTWAQPSLLENALEEHELVVQRAMGEVIRALHSDDPRRRMWGAEKVLSSYAARDHPFAPARSGVSVSVSESRTVSFRWRPPDVPNDEPATESFERDGKTFEVPKYGGYTPPDGDRASDDPIEGEVAMPPASIEHEAPSPEPSAVESIPEPPRQPKWLGPGGPPPLVAHLYQPWVPPRLAPQQRREPESPPQPVAWRRMSRGGYR